MMTDNVLVPGKVPEAILKRTVMHKLHTRRP